MGPLEEQADYAHQGRRRQRRPENHYHAPARKARVDLFVTNDERLGGKVVPGVQFITSLARAFV